MKVINANELAKEINVDREANIKADAARKEKAKKEIADNIISQIKKSSLRSGHYTIRKDNEYRLTQPQAEEIMSEVAGAFKAADYKINLQIHFSKGYSDYARLSVYLMK